MHAFLSVGSTRFDTLVSSAFQERFLSRLQRKGFHSLVVQCGNSAFDLADTVEDGEKLKLTKCGIEIEYWKFKPSLEEEYRKADLVISHAGSGTILDVLRRGKAMIVIPNPTLLDNHQEELASTLQSMGYLISTTVEDLPVVLDALDMTSIKTFPSFEGARFAKIVDEALGFI